MENVNLPDKIESIWMATAPATNFLALTKNIETEVVVIGGGLAGVNIAYSLKQKGFKVVLIEAGRIGCATSANTTAKVTSLHELKYKYLVDSFGVKKAQMYADANQWAIKELGDIVERENIDCDFHIAPTYTFTTEQDGIAEIEQEIEIAKSLHLPATFSKPSIPESLNILGAIRFDNQAYFHPRKYIIGLANKIDDDTCHIFENTRATEMSETPDYCEVKANNYTIKAKFVIEATNYPSLIHSGPLSGLSMTRSVIIASKINTTYPDGMFIGTAENDLSFRPHEGANKKWLITGAKHRGPDDNRDLSERLVDLAKQCDDAFSVQEIQYKWGAADTMSPDRIPLIGKIPGAQRLFVATGFSAWGMTNSFISARLLTDIITGTENEWQELYNPNRLGR